MPVHVVARVEGGRGDEASLPHCAALSISVPRFQGPAVGQFPGDHAHGEGSDEAHAPHASPLGVSVHVVVPQRIGCGSIFHSHARLALQEGHESNVAGLAAAGVPVVVVIRASGHRGGDDGRGVPTRTGPLETMRGWNEALGPRRTAFAVVVAVPIAGGDEAHLARGSPTIVTVVLVVPCVQPCQFRLALGQGHHRVHWRAEALVPGPQALEIHVLGVVQRVGGHKPRLSDPLPRGVLVVTVNGRAHGIQASNLPSWHGRHETLLTRGPALSITIVCIVPTGVGLLLMLGGLVGEGSEG
mmetsp:Transcript_10544/g.18648  ORF Transcript_10544/g.18648 Transcript_10544/m.18648 type:complete len:299 (+) Transcript_10544:2710-3606(+)